MKTIELTDDEADVIKILCENRKWTIENVLEERIGGIIQEIRIIKSILEKLQKL